jgi:Protein of unknown function (DUF3306)
MSGSEPFLARWSRLKRETASERDEADSSSVPAQPAASDTGNASELREAGSEPPPFDPASLPPIESITADSDIRAFLQAGVPAELTRAALRRVWTSDPAIRDFIGLAENQWDFTDPAAIPGFGPLEPTDKAGELVTQAMGKLREAVEPVGGDAPRVPASSGDESLSKHEPVQVAGMPEQMTQRSENDGPVKAGTPAASAAPQHGLHDEEQSSVQTPPNRRSHGRALPR